jgi:hypothetical protein
MSIELKSESIISLAQAARLLPPGRRGRPVTLSCVLRWILDGVKIPAGRVRLEAIRIGGRWLTSIEAMERFAARQTPDLEGNSLVMRPPGSQRRTAQRAAEQLTKKGV